MSVSSNYATLNLVSCKRAQGETHGRGKRTKLNKQTNITQNKLHNPSYLFSFKANNGADNSSLQAEASDKDLHFLSEHGFPLELTV